MVVGYKNGHAINLWGAQAYMYTYIMIISCHSSIDGQFTKRQGAHQMYLYGTGNCWSRHK